MTDARLLRILYVGRKPKVAEYLQTILGQRNTVTLPAGNEGRLLLEFHPVSNQKAALALMRAYPPALVIVEIEKKTDSRVRFCEMVRYRLPTAAILAVTGTKPESTFVFDGYIRLPLVAQQVFNALEPILNECNDHLLQLGPLHLNIATRMVSTPKGAYAMTPKQCALLQMLMIHRDKVVKRGEIMQSIWETSYLEDTRTLDVHIRWLRERIEPDPSNPTYLKTVRGVGYCLSI
jgi:DNA-binding response OmpR family regulator